jgi:hypothetical protein
VNPWTLITALWEKSSFFTKLLLLWAFGPAFLMYMFLGYKESFKSEILADVRTDRENWAAPRVARRDAQFESLNSDIREIKTDVRDIRNALIGPRKGDK